MILPQNSYLLKKNVPLTLVKKILILELHSRDGIGHVGREKTATMHKDKYFWPNIKKDVAILFYNVLLINLLKVINITQVYIHL